MIVVNEAVATIGQDDIQATVVEASGSVLPLPRQPKQQAAESLLDAIVHNLSETLKAESKTGQ